MSEQLKALNACKAACERIIDQYDGEVTAGIDWRALLGSIDRALSTHHAAPGAPQQEASGETVAAFLELARLYCSVTETPSGDVSWTFATRDIEGFAVEVINQHRSRAAATAPAGGLTDPLRDLSAGGQFDLLGEKPLTTAARAAEPDMVQQCMAIINAAWAAIPEHLRVDDGTDPTGNPLPAAVRALAARAAEPEREVWIVVKEHVWEHGDGGRPTLAYLIPAEFGRQTFPSFDAASAWIRDGNWPLGWVAMKLDLATSPTPPTGTSKEGGEHGA